MRISDWSSDVCSSDLAVTARGEGAAICRVALGVEQRRIAPVARDAVAFEIGYMLGERRGAKAHALVPHDPRLNDDAAALRPKARHRYGAPSASGALCAPAAPLAPRRSSEERRVGKVGVSKCRVRW